MRKFSFLAMLCLVSFMSAQQTTTAQDTHHFKVQVAFGVGLGFENIDLFVDEDNKASSISGGGGFHVGLSGRYVFRERFEFGTSFLFHSSTLRPELSNVSTSFNRVSIAPTFKYLIGLNTDRSQTLNLGVGYGFYVGGRMKIDADELNASANLKYKSASGIHLLTEYEINGTKRFDYLIGLKYYGVSYENKQPIGGADINDLDGSGIDLYFGISYQL